MHDRSWSFVFGFHGCDRKIGESLLREKTGFKGESHDYHWLGQGIYFWENDPERALLFAKEKRERDLKLRGRSTIRDPFVIGAVIFYGRCLDLMSLKSSTILKEAHRSVVAKFKTSDLPVPRNVGKQDKVVRKLDCAVIDQLHDTLNAMGGAPIDTIRGLFLEGQALWPGSGFREKTHTQICVRNPSCVRAVFRTTLEWGSSGL